METILTVSKTLCMSHYFQIVSQLILQLKIGQVFNCSNISIDYQYRFLELRILLYSFPQHHVDFVLWSFKYYFTVCARLWCLDNRRENQLDLLSLNCTVSDKTTPTHNAAPIFKDLCSCSFSSLSNRAIYSDI